MSSILQLDIAGNPTAWINHRQAITLMATERVIANLGEQQFMFCGGYNRISGMRSEVLVSSIILTRAHVRARRFSKDYVPPLSNKGLFARDGYRCLYCGEQYPASQLTRDHIIPRSRNGDDSWHNSATCCLSCNHEKGCRTPEEWGNLLLAVPFAPNWAEFLYLKNTRRMYEDQLAFLQQRFPKDSSLLSLEIALESKIW